MTDWRPLDIMLCNCGKASDCIKITSKARTAIDYIPSVEGLLKISKDDW